MTPTIFNCDSDHCVHMALLFKSLSSRVLASAAMKRRITTDARQILMSPPLISIDFPDIWTSSSCPDYSSTATSYGTSLFHFNPPCLSSPFSPVQIQVMSPQRFIKLLCLSLNSFSFGYACWCLLIQCHLQTTYRLQQ